MCTLHGIETVMVALRPSALHCRNLVLVVADGATVLRFIVAP